MNDEFTVTKIVEIGSEGGMIEFYNLSLQKRDQEIEDMSPKELVRLSDFLQDYTADMRKGVKHDA